CLAIYSPTQFMHQRNLCINIGQTVECGKPEKNRKRDSDAKTGLH
ncbi:MAG: hypothetical protein ACI9HK_006216, partial [Pirellulaceae bacterium]